MSKDKSFEDIPYMICGCKAMAQKDGEPYCLIHNVSEIDHEMTKRLEGRTARCAYYGKEHRKCECLYNGCIEEDKKMICRCEQPSTKALPFFQYMGPESMAAQMDCKVCSYKWNAHLPRWNYVLLLRRDWYKKKDITSDYEKTVHKIDRTHLDEYLEKEIERMMRQSKSPSTINGSPSKTVIHEITIKSIKGPLPSGRGHDFEPHGAYEYDKFYCGCHSWN